MDIFTQIIMWVATVITGVMFVPQAYKTYKLKSVGDLSIISYSLVLFGTSGWVLWGGLGTASGPEWGALISNACILVVASPIVWYLYKSKHSLLPFLLYGAFIAIIVVAIVLAVLRPTMNPFMASAGGKTFGLIWSICSGAGTGFAFMPQTFKQVKSKSFIGLSILTTVLLIACNFGWVLYYVLKIIKIEDLTLLPPIIYSAISGSVQVVVLAAFMMNKNKSTKA